MLLTLRTLDRLMLGLDKTTVRVDTIGSNRNTDLTAPPTLVNIEEAVGCHRHPFFLLFWRPYEPGGRRAGLVELSNETVGSVSSSLSLSAASVNEREERERFWPFDIMA